MCVREEKDIIVSMRYHFNNSHDLPNKGSGILPTFDRGKSKFKEIILLAQSHRAGRKHSWGSNIGLFDSKA